LLFFLILRVFETRWKFRGCANGLPGIGFDVAIERESGGNTPRL